MSATANARFSGKIIFFREYLLSKTFVGKKNFRIMWIIQKMQGVMQ